MDNYGPLRIVLGGEFPSTVVGIAHRFQCIQPVAPFWQSSHELRKHRLDPRGRLFGSIQEAQKFAPNCPIIRVKSSSHTYVRQTFHISRSLSNYGLNRFPAAETDGELKRQQSTTEIHELLEGTVELYG